MVEHTETILIAEDDPLILKTTASYLKSKGFTVLESADGRKALALFREKKPDLLLSDLRMPELDGMELIKIIVEEDPEIPVIIFSGMGTTVDVIEALRIGAWDYLTKPILDLEILIHSIDKALERADLLREQRNRHASLEQEVKNNVAEIMRAKQQWERTVDAMPDMIAIVDKQYQFVRMNATMLAKLGTTFNELLGTKCHLCAHGSSTPPDYCPHSQLLEDGKSHSVEIYDERLGGHCKITVVPYRDVGGVIIGSVHIVRDINEQKKAEREKEKLHARLLHAQKLESVGQLAAGIAHEINTPTQFIGTNIDFLDEAAQDITTFMEQIMEITKEAPSEIVDAIHKAKEEMDWDYLAEEMPLAISQSHEGVKRVTSIVRAMKEFSHPGSKEKELLNLNTIINTTVTVARNEWKYVADVGLDLDPELPAIPLLADEMGQVILNMLVNAAHAIADKLGPNPEGDKGKITISTRKMKDHVQLRIRDTGAGMPKEIQIRIFDPFYTTKKVGKGTGQGLAICHDVIVDKHQGTVAVESSTAEGTTFIIQLPLKDGENG